MDEKKPTSSRRKLMGEHCENCSAHPWVVGIGKTTIAAVVASITVVVIPLLLYTVRAHLALSTTELKIENVQSDVVEVKDAVKDLRTLITKAINEHDRFVSAGGRP